MSIVPCSLGRARLQGMAPSSDEITCFPPHPWLKLLDTLHVPVQIVASSSDDGISQEELPAKSLIWSASDSVVAASGITGMVRTTSGMAGGKVGTTSVEIATASDHEETTGKECSCADESSDESSDSSSSAVAHGSLEYPPRMAWDRQQQRLEA